MKRRKGTKGRSEQHHIGLFQNLVPLLQITGAAGGDHILPDGSTPQRFWNHMVDGQLFPSIPSAILASEVISLEDVLFVKGQYIIDRAVDVTVEANDRGKDDHEGWRGEDSVCILYPLGLAAKEQDNRPPGRAYMQRLIRLVQHQDLYLVDHDLKGMSGWSKQFFSFYQKAWFLSIPSLQ